MKEKNHEEKRDGIKSAIICVTLKTDFRSFYKVRIDTNHPR